MGQQPTIHFPSGASEDKVKKDAKKIQKSNPGMALHDALDAAAKQHGATTDYRRYITQARAEATPEPESEDDVLRTPSGHIQFCAKCSRPATTLSFGIPFCKYHADPDIEEDDIPPYEEVIPEDAVCFHEDCMQEPTHIYGGVCFCDQHYEDARQGNRYRRMIGL